jgi:inosine-uridine nucleoside N-ribohydrolase
MTSVLLDTDIGNDIDDALCLAYLLAEPECDLVGITTVCGEPELRAEMASAMCHAASFPYVPIHPGSPDCLHQVQTQPTCPQATALGDWRRDREFESYSAVEFMRQTIRNRPGEITLLTIGPLTNIGLLFKVDPEIPRLIKELVMMVGHFDPAKRIPETNAKIDVWASDIVFKAPVPRLRAVGLDVTMQCQMPADQVRKSLDVPRLGPALDFAEVWFKSVDHITFHDPLAAVDIFYPDVLEYETGEIIMDLSDGMTVTGLGHQHELASRVATDRFFQHYLSVIRS